MNDWFNKNSGAWFQALSFCGIEESQLHGMLYEEVFKIVIIKQQKKIIELMTQAQVKDEVIHQTKNTVIENNLMQDALNMIARNEFTLDDISYCILAEKTMNEVFRIRGMSESIGKNTTSEGMKNENVL